MNSSRSDPPAAGDYSLAAHTAARPPAHSEPLAAGRPGLEGEGKDDHGAEPLEGTPAAVPLSHGRLAREEEGAGVSSLLCSRAERGLHATAEQESAALIECYICRHCRLCKRLRRLPAGAGRPLPGHEAEHGDERDGPLGGVRAAPASPARITPNEIERRRPTRVLCATPLCENRILVGVNATFPAYCGECA
jgi:hypothetical protein